MAAIFDRGFPRADVDICRARNNFHSEVAEESGRVERWLFEKLILLVFLQILHFIQNDIMAL